MKAPNDPAQGLSQSAGITPAQNELIIRYEQTKRITRWLLIFFILSGITYTILTARSERLPESAISASKMGQNKAVLGNMVVLSSIRDNKQEILLSRDNDKLFFRTGETCKSQHMRSSIQPDDSKKITEDQKSFSSYLVQNNIRVTNDKLVQVMYSLNKDSFY